MFEITKNTEQTKILKEYLMFTVNWKRVRFVHHEPQFVDKKKSPEPKSQILFKTHFSNCTDYDQEYSFKTERTTSSVCEIQDQRAVTVGYELNLNFKTPCDVFAAQAGFKRELSLTNCQGETIEESLTWDVDSVIKVPSHHKTIAELVVFEDEFEGNFSMSSDISGKVLVFVTNVRDNNSLVKSIEGDIGEIMKKELENGLKGFTVESGIVSFVTKWRCNFCYGVEQHVTLNQEELNKS